MSDLTSRPLTQPIHKSAADRQIIAQTLPRNLLVGLALVGLIYLMLAVTFSQVTPFNKGPDEGYHLEYITFLKQNGRLPNSYEERAQITRADFPPLYHLAVALCSTGVSVAEPPGFKIFWDSFRYRAMDLQTDLFGIINTEDYQPPYLGQFLVWQIGRWLSIGFSLATVLVVFLALREVPFAQLPWLALVGAALLAFLPQYIFLGSSLNDDSLLGLLCAFYFWLLIKIIKTPDRWGLFAGAGILLGLSITVKYTLIVGFIELAVIGFWLTRKKGWTWAGQRLSLAVGLALLSSSWWFGWNLWFLNTVSQDGWTAGLLKPLLAGGSDTTLNRLGGFFSGGQIGLTDLPENTRIGTFSEWLRSTFLSLWGVGIGESIPLFPYAYLGIAVLMGVALFGLWRLWRTDPASRKWLLLMAGHIAIFFVLPLIRFALSRRLGQTAQGRHILIPAAVAIVGLLVWGVARVVPPRWQRWVFVLLLIGFGAWTGAHLYRLDTYAAPPLPLRTLPQAAEWLPNPVKAQFGDGIELVSYRIDPQPAQGELDLDLAWRSLAHVNENYLLKVTLLDKQAQVVSHWLGYNGQGRLPTLAWNPGDSVFDRLALPLPNLPAGDYTVQVQFIGQAGPLPMSEPGKGSVSLDLAKISLAKASVLSLPERLTLTDADQIVFALWRADGPTAAAQLPNYRYPATIAVVAEPGQAVNLVLVDETGQEWPADQANANIFTFVIGPRWPSGAYRLKAAEGSEGKSVTDKPVLTVENWWPRQFTAPAIATPSEANFANQLKFLGYNLPQQQVKAGEAFPLTLYWQAMPNKAPQADFVQFNHLLDSTGKLYGGYDRMPLEYYSTLLWAPGEVVVDGYAVPVNAAAPPGQYYLNVGYYLTVGEAAVNLPLVVDGQMSETSSVTIGPVEVVAP